MKTILKIIKEIIVLVFILFVSGIGIFFLVKNIKAEKGYTLFSGKIVKKELSIVSPVFGSVESLPAQEGQLVKKGDTIAVIKIFTYANSSIPNIDSETFSVDNGKIKVISPEDAIVAREIFTENSILKPGADFIFLYPLKDVVVKINVPDGGPYLSSYNNLLVVLNNKEFQIENTQNLPIDQDQSGQGVNYAAFVNQIDSTNFYNQQIVNIKALNNPVIVRSIPTFNPTPISSPTLSPSPIGKQEKSYPSPSVSTTSTP